MPGLTPGGRFGWLSGEGVGRSGTRPDAAIDLDGRAGHVDAAVLALLDVERSSEEVDPDLAGRDPLGRQGIPHGAGPAPAGEGLTASPFPGALLDMRGRHHLHEF